MNEKPDRRIVREVLLAHRLFEFGEANSIFFISIFVSLFGEEVFKVVVEDISEEGFEDCDAEVGVEDNMEVD
ncbi:MAG TPA: hypothetical protein VGB93_03870, partial [Methylovirgula sp.]